jgi:membrane protein implicated in regulation of membrane protease activity
MQMLWWYWVVLGLVLVVAELAVPAFFIIWFGLGALLTGMCVWAFPAMSLAGQVFLWTVSSLVFVWLWFKVFKTTLFKTRVGMSTGQFVGEVGVITGRTRPFEMGRIKFQKPILGSDTWACRSDEELNMGDRAKVLDVEGQIVRVTRL